MRVSAAMPLMLFFRHSIIYSIIFADPLLPLRHCHFAIISPPSPCRCRHDAAISMRHLFSPIPLLLRHFRH
jgi:hypothetical protein